MIKLNSLQVIKRDGSKEQWSLDKLVVSIGKAGVPEKDAQRIAKEIENWAMNSAQNQEILSAEIKNKVIEFLSLDFPAQAEIYKTYKKYSEG